MKKNMIKKMRVMATTILLSVALAFNSSAAEDAADTNLESVVAVDDKTGSDETVGTTSDATDSRDKDGCDVDTFLIFPRKTGGETRGKAGRKARGKA